MVGVACEVGVVCEVGVSPDRLPPHLQELVPVLLGVLTRQSESRSREQLLHMIFNLIKKPDKTQRSAKKR